MSKPISPEDAALDEILRNGERSDDEEEAELTPALPVPLPRIPAGPNRGRVHPSTPPPGSAPLPEPRLPSTRPGTAGIPVSAPPGAPLPTPGFDSNAAPQGLALPSAGEHKDTLPGIAQVPPHVAAQVPAPLPAPAAELRGSSTLAGLPAMRAPERLPSKPPGLGLPATPPQVGPQARLPAVSPPAERLPSRTPVPGLPATPPPVEGAGQARLPSVSPPERLPSRPPVPGLPAAPPQVGARTSSPPVHAPLPVVVPPAAKTPLPAASKSRLEPLAAEPDTLRQDKAALSAIHDRPSTELARRAWSEPPPRIPSKPPQKASLAELAAEVQQAPVPAKTASKEDTSPAPGPTPVRSARVRKIAWLSLLAFVGAGALVAVASLARGALEHRLNVQGASVPAAKLLSSIALPALVPPPGSSSSDVAATASASAPLPPVATAVPSQQPVDISSLPAASTKPPTQQEPPATGESKHKTATATTKPPAASAHPTAKPSDKVPDFGGRE